MKTLLFIILLILSLSLISCYREDREESKKNGMILKDAYGRYYRLDYRMGVVFALQPIDTNQIKIFK